MNSIQLPAAVRATAAALAVFMTVATLNSLISVAGPDQKQLMAKAAARQAASLASAPRHAEIVAQLPMTAIDH